MDEQTVIIREQLPADKEQILELFQQFGSYFEKLDPLKRCIVGPGYAEDFYAAMQKDIQEGEGMVYVAETNGIVIGFIAGNIKDITSVESIPQHKGRVLEFFVEQNSRSKGVGTKLMQKLEEYFKGKKCDSMNVDVFAPNVPGRNFYQKWGFFERNIDLIKLLN